MTEYNHTAIATGAAANASTFNTPLGQLDAAIKKNEYAKTTAPGVGDDTADGYTVGSMWIDTTNDRIYTCVDATAGAAIWRRLDIADDTLILGAMALYSVYGVPVQGILGPTGTARYVATWRLDDAAALESVGCSFQYLGVKTLAAFNVDVFWAMETAVAGDVVLEVALGACVDGGDMDAAVSIVTSTVTVPGTAHLMKKTTFAVTLAVVSGALLRITVSRTGSAAGDTAAGDCHIIGATVRYS